MSITGLLLLYLLRFSVDWYEVKHSKKLKRVADATKDRIDDIRQQVYVLKDTIESFEARFTKIENELKLHHSDASILKQWIDKRDLELLRIEAEFVKALKLEQRQQELEKSESRIIQLSENLRLITSRKKV